MRWHALDVDYEMAGKDLIDSVTISGRICRALGGTPPEGFNYELFLDQNGEKISKSRGNGLTIDEWLRYGTPGKPLRFSCTPSRARRSASTSTSSRVMSTIMRGTSSSTIGRTMMSALPTRYGTSTLAIAPAEEQPLSYAVLLNLASVCNAADEAILWGFISRYLPGTSPETHPLLDRLARLAVHYYRDVVRKEKHYRIPDEKERNALADLAGRLETLPDTATGEDFQSETYATGRDHGFEAPENLVRNPLRGSPWPALRTAFRQFHGPLRTQRDARPHPRQARM